MSYKVYREGNYIRIIDTIKGELFNGAIKDVFVDKSNVQKENYRIFNVKDFDDKIVLAIADILKQDGTPYTVTEWETFYTANTGNFNGGGSTPTTDNTTNNSTVNGATATDALNTLNAGKEDVVNKVSAILGNEASVTKYPNVKGVVDWVTLNVQTAPFLGTIVPTSTPTGTGAAYWIAVQAGTYTNFGGVIVSTNSFAVVSRSSTGTFSMSQTPLNLTGYVAKTEVVDNLVSTTKNVPLSALQGKMLNDFKAELVPLKNKFNINAYDVQLGYFVSSSSGNASLNASYNSTGFIRIKSNTQYFLSFKNQIAWYDINQIFISGDNVGNANGAVVTSPSNAVYLRCSVLLANWANFQVEESTFATPYEAYKTLVPINNVDTTSISLALSNKADLIVGKNKYNYQDGSTTVGSYITSLGKVGSNASYSCTNYIQITAGLAYYNNSFTQGGSTYYAYYDINKVLILSSNIFGTIAPINSVYLRYTINKTTGFNTVQIEEGNTGTIYESYKKIIPDNQLDLNSLQSQLDKKPTLIPSKNLFNKDKASIGFYSSPDGDISTNASYDLSEYIAVQPNTTYTSTHSMRYSTYYDVNKVVILGGISNLKVFTTPVNTAFVRISISHIDLNTFALQLGTAIPSYTPYKDIVSPNNLEIYQSQIIPDAGVITNIFKLFLPKEIYIAVGRTIELYHNQVSWSGNVSNYHFLWSGIGHSMKRKWFCAGTVDNIGSYTLNLKVFDSNNILLAEKNTIVKIGTNIITNPFKLNTIGDSLTGSKPWQPELVALSGNKITLVGTRGTVVGAIRTHDGRSGASSSYYLGNNSYTNDTGGMVGNDGRTQNLNPYWSPNTSDVNFDYYKSNYNQSPDKLVIWLGTNGMDVDPTVNATNIKTFIDKIRATGGSTIPIFVVHTLFRGNQDGIGIQTGSDGYIVNNDYKLEADLKVFNLQEKMYNDLKDYTNLFLVPVSTCHDSEYNFGAVSTPVNPRASQVEYLPVEATHPQNQGYLQIADVIFSALALNQ